MPLTASQASGPTSTPLLHQTISAALAETVARHPDGEALVACHQGIRWTYAEYAREIDRLAAGLLSLGIERGDRVGIWSPNRYEWCLTQFATARIGAILV
jgi:fatty-acyl-CoA synthase